MGDDTFLIGGSFGWDQSEALNYIHGGTGYDTVVLRGERYETFKAVITSVDGIEEILAGSGRCLIDASALQQDIVLRAGGYNFDTLIAGSGNDELVGSRNGDILWGNAGNDYLHADWVAGGMSNEMHGGDGDDRLESAGGADRMWGGNGDDTSRGGNNADRFWGGNGNDSGYGDNGNDRLFGGNGHDFLRGGTGDDFISGEDGADRLYGDAGNDRISGGQGTDQIRGGLGNDFIAGGTERDDMYGGRGADRFIFANNDFAGLAPNSTDRIFDFSHDDGDRIVLTSVDADTSTVETDPLTFIADAAFSGTAGELRYEWRDGNTYVQGDTNGDSATDFAIRLDGELTLVNSDFVL